MLGRLFTSPCVESNDKFSNLRDCGIDGVSVQVNGFDSLPAPLEWNAASKKYHVEFTAEVAGVYEVSVAVGGGLHWWAARLHSQ